MPQPDSPRDDDARPQANPETAPEEGTSFDERARSLNERWWWSGALWTGVGIAVVAYQWPVITDSGPAPSSLWANWTMAVVGAALAAVGAWRLWKDWTREKARRAAEADESA